MVSDMIMSGVLSRDHILGIGYFGSVTRLNTRIRALRAEGFVRVLETPFYNQFLYSAGPKAGTIVGEHIASLLSSRSASPRFIQHCLCVTNARLRLMAMGMQSWRFEQQARSTFRYGGRDLEVRPDGVALFEKRIAFIEADLGHVAPAKFREKLTAYNAFVASGECRRVWGMESFRLLTLTTGPKRAESLRRLTPQGSAFEHRCVTFEEFEIPAPGGWS
ncbi:MAG: replication-relaxation family protein [Fimbriimonadaceae bacterium]